MTWEDYEKREAESLKITVEDLRYIKKVAIPVFNIDNPLERPLNDVVRFGGRRFIVSFYHDGTVYSIREH